MVQGVGEQEKPVEVETAAPGGVEATLKSVVVPRTTVAQAPRQVQRASADAAQSRYFSGRSPLPEVLG